MLKLPVIHNPENRECPKSQNAAAPCRCSDRAARAWTPSDPEPLPPHDVKLV